MNEQISAAQWRKHAYAATHTTAAIALFLCCWLRGPVRADSQTPLRQGVSPPPHAGIVAAPPKLLRLQVQQGTTVRTLTPPAGVHRKDSFAATVRPLSPGSLWVLLQHGEASVQTLYHVAVPPAGNDGRFRPLRLPLDESAWIPLLALAPGDALCIATLLPSGDARQLSCRTRRGGRGDDPPPPPPPPASPSTGGDRGASSPPPPVDGDGSRGPEDLAVLLLPIAP